MMSPIQNNITVGRLVHLYIFGLRVAEEMLDVARQINESKDVKDKAMQYEFKTIQISYMRMLQYVLDRLKNASQYSFNDFTTLGDSVTASIQRNLNSFNSVSVSYIEPGLQAIIDSSGSDRIKNEYLALRHSLSKYESPE